jgi:signal transduction histidine kinase
MKLTNPSRKLTINYLVSLLTILTLASVSQYLVKASLDKQISDGALINVSGKQVFLSQQLAKNVLLLSQATDAQVQARLIEDIRLQLGRWERTHQKLVTGTGTQKLTGSVESQIIVMMYEAIAPAQQKLATTLNTLVKSYGTVGFEDALTQARSAVLEHEDRYATGMDRIVYQYALEAKEKVKNTEQVQLILFLSILSTLVLIGLLVFRPAVRRIGADVKRLNEAYQRLEQQTQDLQRANTEIAAQKARVEESHAEIQRAYQELNSAKNQLVQSEKMAALGQLIAGVAHEINTPLGAINASNGTLSKSVNVITNELPELGKSFTPDVEAIFQRMVEISQQADTNILSSREERQLRKSLQDELEQMEIENAGILARELVKMGVTPESLTELAPVFKLPQAEKLIETASLSGKMRMHMNYIDLAVSKMQKIVFALKTYSHRQVSDEPILADINKNIDAVLTIYHNQLKYGIELDLYMQKDLPETFCYPDELNQVWTNLIHNSIQAMNGQGYMRISTLLDNEHNNIVVKVTDHGPGIPPEVQARMWEPFFTTKPAGEGSGLGLDIVKRIINKHKGKIEVESEPGLTTFTVSIPWVQHYVRSEVPAEPVQELAAPALS